MNTYYKEASKVRRKRIKIDFCWREVLAFGIGFEYHCKHLSIGLGIVAIEIYFRRGK